MTDQGDVSGLTRIIYTPEGASKRVWEIDLTNPPTDVMRYAPKAVGCGWLSFINRIADADWEACQALVWVLRRRDEPGLDIEKVDFPTGLLREFLAESVEEPDDEAPKA